MRFRLSPFRFASGLCRRLIAPLALPLFACAMSVPLAHAAFDFTFNGHFGPGAERAAGDFATGDVNGDGLVDVAFTESQGSFTTHIGVQFGDGHGNFSGLTDLDSPGDKGGVRLADVNRDGKLDLVYTGKGDGTLRTRFGNGDGTFGAEVVRGQLAPSNPVSALLTQVELADVNGDGYLDAIGSSINAGIRVMLDNGTGTFGGLLFTYDGAGGVNNMVVLDVSGDGRPDVIFASRVGPDLNVLSNILLPGSPQLKSVSFDGGLDADTVVAAAATANGIVWALTENPVQGTGRVVVGRNPGDAPTDVNVMSGFLDCGRAAVADFNGDGVADLAFPARLDINSATGTIHLYSGVATNTPFQGSPTLIPSGWTIVGASSADLNQDGNADLVAIQIGRNGSFDDFDVYLSNQQSLVVSTTADENNGNARWNSGTGTSLREAIAYANGLNGTRTITFAPFLGNANAVVNVTNGPLAIQAQGTINFTVANTRGRITLDGNNTASPLIASGSATLSLRDLTIRNFRSGSIFGANGGAVFVDFDGRLNVDRVTFTGNTATGRGGAIYGDQLSQIAVRNSTFTGNSGDGAIAADTANGTVMTLENNTISGNSNGGVRGTAGTYTLRNNIVAGNVSADLSGSFTGSHNIVQNGGTAGLAGTIVGNPLLNGLADNGGPANTMSLQLGSPAIDAGTSLAGVTTDQRGISRPQNGGHDIGAFEARIAPTPTLTPNALTVAANQTVNLAAATNPNPPGGTFSGEGVTNGIFNPVGLSAGVKTITYATPAGSYDLPGSTTLTITVQSLAVASANVGIRLSANPIREGDTLTIWVDVSNMRDQLGNPITPTSGSCRLTVGGVDQPVQTFSAGQLALGSFTSQFSLGVPDDTPSGTAGDLTPVVATVTLDSLVTSASSNLTVNNGAPEVLQLSAPATVKQGDAFTFSGSFFDPGPLDTHTVTIDWKDGTANTVLNLPAGQTSFSTSHAYGPQVAVPVNLAVAVTVADDDLGSVSGIRTINVTYGESLVVTTTTDEDNGTSAVNVGAGTSLREAVKYAATLGGASTITFAPALAGQTVSLTTAWSNANGNESGSALTVGGNLTVQGPTAGAGVTLAVAPAAPLRHFLVAGGASLTLNNLTLTGGKAPTSGFNFGGSVWSFGSLTLKGCTFTGNTTTGEGGAVQCWGDSPLFVAENCTFAGNASQGIAGAFDAGAAQMTLRHLTVTNNSATNGYAVVFWKNSATLTNCLIAGNANEGIGSANGGIATGSNNIIGSNDGAGLAEGVNGNRLNVTAGSLYLGALAANGGPTATVALGGGSVAIDAGTSIAGMTTDQRGWPRFAPTHGGLIGRFYTLPGGGSTALLSPFSNLEALTPSAMAVSPRVDFGAGTESTAGDGSVLDRGGSGGNPFGGIGINVGVDNMAALWSGYLTAPETADYRFTTRSDDGSVLYIDGVLVVNNNFLQPMANASGTVRLTAGKHAIRIGYYEVGGEAGMQLSWEQLTGSAPFTRQIVPPGALSFGSAPDVGAYEYEPVTAAAPTFTQASGSYEGRVTVTVVNNAPTAAVRYTVDGSTPTETHGTLYTGPFALLNTATVRAVAYGGNWLPSPVSTATYTVLTSLEAWRALHGLPSDGSQDFANPSRDGLTNQLKFAFNLAPAAGDLLRPSVTEAGASGNAGLPAIFRDAQGRLVIRFVRRKASTNPGVAYVPEVGGAFDAWTALDLATATVENIDATWERVTVTDPVVGAGRRFGRVRVISFAPYLNDFASGLGTASVRGSAVWSNGAVMLTDTVGGQLGALVFDGVAATPELNGFTARFTLTLGPTTTGIPADGVTFSVGNLPAGAWSETGPGTPQSLTVGFDTYNNGGDGDIGIHLWVGGTHIAANPTNPFTNGTEVPVEISYDVSRGITVRFDGALIFNDVAMPGFTFPPGGRFGFGARTGGANERALVDQVQIVPR